MHPLFPLCVRFAIIPGNPFGAVIHFHPLSSARLPMNIRLTSPLHTTHVRYFPFCFRKFSQILSISGADENGWSQPRNFARPLCPLCIRFVSVGQWDRAITSLHNIELFTPTGVVLSCVLKKLHNFTQRIGCDVKFC